MSTYVHIFFIDIYCQNSIFAKKKKKTIFILQLQWIFSFFEVKPHQKETATVDKSYMKSKGEIYKTHIRLHLVLLVLKL